MLEGVNLNDLVQVLGEICLGFVYGITVCFIFWKQDKADLYKTNKLKRIGLFLVPLLIVSLTWFGPSHVRLKEMMGFTFPFYSVLSSVFSLYPIPAFISVLILLKLRKNSSRWLYAAIPFFVVILFLVYRLIQGYKLISGQST